MADQKIVQVDIGDEDISQADFTPEELEAEDTDWKNKSEELLGLNKRRATKLKNAKEAIAQRDAKIAEMEKTLAELQGQKKSDSTPDKKQPDEFGLLQKTYLRAAGITEEDEVELARDIQKRTGLDWDKLVDDDYFKTKLEALRTEKANKAATSNLRGGAAPGQAKNTTEYWIAKGTIPKPEDVPDRKLRAKIIREMMKQSKEGGKFYNE